MERIITWLEGQTSRICRVDSMPFSPGIVMSMITTSGLNCVALDTASLPWATSATTLISGCASRSSRSPSRSTAWLPRNVKRQSFYTNLYYCQYNDYRAFSGTQHPFRHTNPGGQSEFTEHAKFGSACFNRFACFLRWYNATPVPTQISNGVPQPMSRANTQLRTRFTRYPLSKLI